MFLVIAIAAAAIATPSPGVVTLADALARARERSPLVDAARARERASTLAADAVPRAPNPFVELRGENMGPVSRDRLNRDVFATVSQPIELGGKRGARVADATAATHQAEADVSSAQWRLDFEITGLYVDAVRARDVLAALVEQRQSVEELAGMLDRRVQEGVGVEADLRRFHTERTRLTSQIARTTITLESSLVRLSAAIGVTVRPDQLVAPLSPSDEPASSPTSSSASAGPPIASDAALAPMPPEAVEKRADVRAAVARVERAEAQARIERARGIADVTVVGGYKRTSGFDTAVAGIIVPLGLFDRNRHGVARAAGEVSAARLELQFTRQQALADAEARWSAARRLGDQASRGARELLDSASVVRTAARAAFIEGRGDLLQLVDAERVFGEAAREAAELRLDAALALIHARLAIGETPLP